MQSYNNLLSWVSTCVCVTRGFPNCTRAKEQKKKTNYTSNNPSEKCIGRFTYTTSAFFSLYFTVRLVNNFSTENLGPTVEPRTFCLGGGVQTVGIWFRLILFYVFFFFFLKWQRPNSFDLERARSFRFDVTNNREMSAGHTVRFCRRFEDAARFSEYSGDFRGFL